MPIAYLEKQQDASTHTNTQGQDVPTVLPRETSRCEECEAAMPDERDWECETQELMGVQQTNKHCVPIQRSPMSGTGNALRWTKREKTKT